MRFGDNINTYISSTSTNGGQTQAQYNMKIFILYLCMYCCVYADIIHSCLISLRAQHGIHHAQPNTHSHSYVSLSVLLRRVEATAKMLTRDEFERLSMGCCFSWLPCTPLIGTLFTKFQHLHNCCRLTIGRSIQSAATNKNKKKRQQKKLETKALVTTRIVCKGNNKIDTIRRDKLVKSS